MSDYHIKRVKEILEKIIYATVATASKDGRPWNSPVAHVYDDELNIYWFSDRESQHSRNIAQNKDAFIVIYDSTAPEGQGEGVYFQVKIEELCEIVDIQKALDLGKSNETPDDFLSDANRRYYKAIPQKIWMNDAEIKDGKFIKDYRVEINIDTLRGLL